MRSTGGCPLPNEKNMYAPNCSLYGVMPDDVQAARFAMNPGGSNGDLHPIRRWTHYLFL